MKELFDVNLSNSPYPLTRKQLLEIVQDCDVLVPTIGDKIDGNFIKESGKKLTIKHDLTKPSINTKLALNSKKAYDVLGWKPKVSIDDGIQKTIQWYKENINE